MIVIVTRSYEEMSKTAYSYMKEIITRKSDAVLGLATGSSPIGLYKEMIADCKAGNVSYKDMLSINLDEYVDLPITHEQSYRSFMNANLFDFIDIDKANTHVPDGNAKDISAACAEYTAFAKEHTVDVQILGIGGNGHIGFNEPGTEFSSNTHVVTLKENTRRDNARFFEDDIDKVPTKAITLGLADIMEAKTIILIANGSGKAQAIRDMVYGPVTPDCPASILQTHPSCFVIVDEAAGYYIKR